MTTPIEKILADDTSFDPSRHIDTIHFDEAGVRYAIEASGPRYLVVVKSAAGRVGSIIVPETYRPRETVGWIVDQGEGTLNHETGERIPPKFNVGDLVMFGEHAGHKVALGNREYRLIQYDSVLGRLTPMEIPDEE